MKTSPVTLSFGVLSLLVLATIFFIPLNSDSDIYQAMAVDLAVYGKLPYTGSWDHNFPGIVYIHWLGVTLFGNSDLGFRTVDLFANGAIAIMLFVLVKRLASNDIASLAPFIYVLYYVGGGWWAIGQRDVFAGLFLLGAVLIFSQSQDHDQTSLSSAILIGAAIGCAAIIRPTYSLALVILLLWRFNWVRAFFYAGGFTIPFALFGAFFVMAGGDLAEVYASVIRYNTEAYGGLAEPWVELLQRSPVQWLLLAMGLAGMVIGAKRHPRNPALRGIVAGSITGLISALVMRKFFVYHFHVLFIFLIPFALIATEHALDLIRLHRYRPLLLSIAAALMLIAFYPRHLLGIAIREQGSLASRMRHVQARFSMDSLFGRSVDLELSKYLGDEKNVELITVTPAVHWMNSLNRPSRFTMVHSLTTRGPSGRLTEFQEEWRAEYLTALEKRRPKIIALADGPGFLMKYIRRTPKDLALEIEGKNGQPGFAQLLREQYVLDTTIGGYYIYTRNVP